MAWLTPIARQLARPDLPLRLVGLATAAYSVSITISPRLLAKPTGLIDEHGQVPLPVAELTRSIGTRDVALAMAMFASPNGYPLLLLAAARFVSDGADAIWFGRMISRTGGQRSQLVKVCGAAAGWASLEAAAAWWSLRGRPNTPSPLAR